MENWLFRLSMPYCVKLENDKIVVKNRRYHNLFEGHFKLPLSENTFELILKNIAHEPDDRFSMCGGVFWLYDDGTIPLNSKDIKCTLLEQYFKRLSLLLELCEGVNYTNNNPLMESSQH